jgi:hypothetical protein
MSLLLKLRFSSLGFLPFVFLVPQDFKVIWLSVYLTWWRLFGFQYTWPDDGYLAFSIPDLMTVIWLSVYPTWWWLLGFQFTWPDDSYLAFSIPDLMMVIWLSVYLTWWRLYQKRVAHWIWYLCFLFQHIICIYTCTFIIASDCCLMPNEQFFSYSMVRTIFKL